MERQPLPRDLRIRMERVFGADFSEVHVIQSSALATHMGAHAVTDGNDLHFAPGRFDPSGELGLELIGHELTHVLQQRQGIEGHAHGGVADPLEGEADAQGARAARGEPARIAREIASPREDSGVAIDIGPPPERRLQAKFAVQLERSGDEQRIQRIHFSGRTDSPFSKSMGAHTTAWVVHCDHVRAVLLNCTLAETATQLRQLCAELEAIASWTWATTVWSTGDASADSDVARRRFWLSRNALVTGLESFEGAESTAQVSIVQRAIASYLEARNYLPMATIDTGKTDGKAEGQHRGALLDLGGDGGAETAWNLFDVNACVVAATADTAKAPGTDGVESEQRIAQALAGHALAVRTAYPEAYGDNDDAFLKIGIELVRKNHTSRGDLLAPAKAYLSKVPPIDRKTRHLAGSGSQSNAAEIVVKDGRLSAINAGRPDSPFSGTQGAHTTAWVVHEDALNTTIGIDLKIEDAGQGLLDAIEALDRSPLAEWVKHLPMSKESARELLPTTGGEDYGYARCDLDAAAALLQVAITDNKVTLELIQLVAQRLLQVENLYPMATTATGHPNSGKGERSLRGLASPKFIKAVWKNFDLGSLATSALDRYLHRREWDSQLRGVDVHSSYEVRIARCIAQHLFYVNAANPEEFAKVSWYESAKKFLEGEEDGEGEEGQVDAEVIAALACRYVGQPSPESVPEEKLQAAEKPRADFEDDLTDCQEGSQPFNAEMLPELEKIREAAQIEYAKERAAVKRKKARQPTQKKKTRRPTQKKKDEGEQPKKKKARRPTQKKKDEGEQPKKQKAKRVNNVRSRKGGKGKDD